MPLSPADFYAYSRATGAPVADTPEDRAKQAPEVLAFQQSRLQAPKQGPGLLDFLGGAALLAGVGAGGYGAVRALRNRGLGQAAAKVAAEEITPQAVQNVRRAAGVSMADPWGQASVPPSGPAPSSRYIPSAPWEVEAAVKPSTVDLSTVSQAAPQERMVRRHGRMVPLSSVSYRPTTTTSFAEETLPSTVDLSAVSQAAPQERMVRRHGRMVPLSSVSYRPTTTTSFAEETLVDVHNAQQVLHTNQTLNALGAAEDQTTQHTVQQLRRNPQVDLSGFGAFSKDASVITQRNKNMQNAAHMMWSFEENLEHLGQQSQALQALRNPPRLYTAQDITGTIQIPGRTRGIAYAESALPSSYGLSHTEVRDRIMAAASASPEEAQMLLNPNVPTEKVRHLLGTTSGLNPTMEMRSYGQMGPTDYESFATRRLQEQAGPEVAQKFLEQRLGTGGTITGIREVNNPEYEELLFNNFIPYWDANSAQGHYLEGQLIKTDAGPGFLHPRNTTVTAEDVKRYGLPPDRMHSNMSFYERKGLEQQIKEDWDKAGTGLHLYEYGKSIGLNAVPQTILQETGGQPLIETLGFKEQTNTGTTFVPGEVQEAQSTLTGSLRQERTKEGVLYPRTNLLGEQSTGVEVTTDPERPFVLQTEPITSTKLIGGYEAPEATPHFLTGPAVPGQRPDIQIAIKNNGQMVPVVKTRQYTFPVNRLDQIKYLPPEGLHQPGSQTLGIQPYMVGDIVNHEGQDFVVKKPIYGPLMERTPKGLKPTTVDITEIQNAAQTASDKWNSLGQTKLDYLANTGNEGDLKYLKEHGYEIIQQRHQDGQTVNKAVAVRKDATNPSELGEAYHYTGYVADQVHQQLLKPITIKDTSGNVTTIPGVDLPVLQDPSAKHQFIGDVTNVTAERQVYGSPYTGEIQRKTKDPLNYGRYGRTWVEDEGYPTQRLPGQHRQLGLSGIDPMQVEDASQAISEGTGVAFNTPRVGQTTPARVTAPYEAIRTTKPYSPENVPNYPEYFVTPSLFYKREPASPPKQLSLPSDIVRNVPARTTAADVAAQQLESYMSKLQRRRATPLTSEVRIQPNLF